MKLVFQNHPFRYECENLAKIFFADRDFVLSAETETAGDFVLAEIQNCQGGKKAIAEIKNGSRRCGETALIPDGSSKEEEEHILCRTLFFALRRCTGISPPWGMLTGVRPVKLLRAALKEFGQKDAVQLFSKKYFVSPEKTALAMDTALNQEHFLKTVPKGAGFYVSVPFCPTRCRYCSFTSFEAASSERLIEPYIKALEQEIVLSGELMRLRGMSVSAVYVGGGTPTVLDEKQLSHLFETIFRSVPVLPGAEICAEAGRPDTFTKAKLSALKKSGVNRISVNPQTLNDNALRKIGRGHTTDDFFRGFSMAHEAGFSSVNVDLIAALPGDSANSFAQSLEDVIALTPQNITIHTLTLKRRSEFCSNRELHSGAETAAQQTTEAAKTLEKSGYMPYYLYRQKGTVGALENTGFCLPGHECHYNVLIMDDNENVVACGAGASTKMISEETLHRSFGAKHPSEYVKNIESELEKKRLVMEFRNTDE